MKTDVRILCQNKDLWSLEEWREYSGQCDWRMNFGMMRNVLIGWEQAVGGRTASQQVIEYGCFRARKVQDNNLAIILDRKSPKDIKKNRTVALGVHINMKEREKVVYIINKGYEASGQAVQPGRSKKCYFIHIHSKVVAV